MYFNSIFRSGKKSFLSNCLTHQARNQLIMQVCLVLTKPDVYSSALGSNLGLGPTIMIENLRFLSLVPIECLKIGHDRFLALDAK
jgi:hypothetical protein